MLKIEHDGPTPVCCGTEMTLIRSGSTANFAIWIWRCAICECYGQTTRRYDGHTFWVGAMGNAVVRRIHELVADAYTPERRRSSGQ